ncbi:unnamed protein product [Dibothriocephalus latus]|uniref:EGF-like domain-containing protein n=1 Tax=Dibothriocephalus latus TaxID=60516 RepID=A0A3P6UQ55_DIBLA|nr:unnamed protein product [Dibothriocephalus latus]
MSYAFKELPGRGYGCCLAHSEELKVGKDPFCQTVCRGATKRDDWPNGVKCNTSPEPCLNETCSRHGVCKPSPESADGFECECERRWRGKRCELRLGACEFEQKRLQELNVEETAICLNNGTCVNNPNGLDFHCQCTPAWEGIRCEKSTHQV